MILWLSVYREKPLALYVFANDEKTVKKFVAETSSGAVCANDTLIYFSGKDRWHLQLALRFLVRFSPFDACDRVKELRMFKWWHH
jgi:hypothetical protein